MQAWAVTGDLGPVLALLECIGGRPQPQDFPTAEALLTLVEHCKLEGEGGSPVRLPPGRAESTWPMRMFTPPIYLPLGIPPSMTHSPVPGQGPSQPSQLSPTQCHPD